MSDKATPSAPASQGSPARARLNERATRCEATKSEDGRPCRRVAGANTDHYGEGPCALHDDGSWIGLTFADDVEAQAAFLDAVRAQTEAGAVPGIRELIEPLGYRRAHVTRLLEADEDFQQAYVEARGYDLDSIRNELAQHRRAGNVPVLLFEARMRLPEAEVLRHSSTRFDGNLDVRGVPYLDATRLTPEELGTLRALLEKASPTAEDLPRDGRPALELVAGEGSA